MKKLGIIRKIEERRDRIRQQRIISQSLRDSLETYAGEGDQDYNRQALENLKTSMDLEDVLSGKKTERMDPRVISSLITGAAGIVVALITYDYGMRMVEVEENGGVVPTRKLSFARFQNPRV